MNKSIILLGVLLLISGVASKDLFTIGEFRENKRNFCTVACPAWDEACALNEKVLHDCVQEDDICTTYKD